MLDGLLAGDGSLHLGRAQASFSITSKYIEWIDHVDAVLTSWGVTVKRAFQAPNGNPYLRTWAYDSFGTTYRRWYPNDKKCIPQDLVVSPTVFRYWYLGDGSLKCRSGKWYSIEVSTYAFSPSSVVRIARQLQRTLDAPYDVRVYLYKAGPVLAIGHPLVPRFLKWVGSCPVRCYDYKWAAAGWAEREILGDLTRLAPDRLHQVDLQWATMYPDRLVG